MAHLFIYFDSFRFNSYQQSMIFFVRWAKGKRSSSMNRKKREKFSKMSLPTLVVNYSEISTRWWCNKNLKMSLWKKAKRFTVRNWTHRLSAPIWRWMFNVSQVFDCWFDESLSISSHFSSTDGSGKQRRRTKSELNIDENRTRTAWICNSFQLTIYWRRID